MPTALIKVGPTYIELAVELKGLIKGTNINIYPFCKDRLIQFKYSHKLSRWLVDQKYYFYDFDKNTLRLPRYYKESIQLHLETNGVDVKIENIKPSKHKKISIKMKKGAKDRKHQIAPIKFLTDKKYHMKALTLQTGQGKTYCAIKAMSTLATPTLIISGNLSIQWEKEILSFTNIKKDEIYHIKGHESISELDQLKEHNYKVFIASTKTLRMFIYNKNSNFYKHVSELEELIAKLKIGTKIIDECHENFGANTMIDLRTKVENNIYLSATYGRSDRVGTLIFNTVFPAKIKYDNDTRDPYIDIYSYTYYIGGMINDSMCQTPQGYNHIKYEKALMKKGLFKFFMKDVVVPLVYSHFINIKKKGQRMLIFCATIDICEKVKEYLEFALFKEDILIDIFVGKTAESVLQDPNIDIIVTTPKSGGTGKDIANLRTSLNTVSFKSWTLCTQVLGRTRELKNGDTPEFVYICNRNIESHLYHRDERKKIYLPRAKKFKEIDM